MDTFSLRMNLGVSKNRLASLHNRQNAEQTQAVASRDMGAHIKEGLGANNGGRANLGLLVGVDIATQFSRGRACETRRRLSQRAPCVDRRDA